MQSHSLRINLGDLAGQDVVLTGDFTGSANAHGLVIFAHGSGSSRFSSRNLAVAEELQRQGLATFLFDLLTEEEDRLGDPAHSKRFEILLLAERLMGVTQWLSARTPVRDMSIGYFGSSTGAAAALVAAAELSPSISAVVCRGGRPDLAKESLPTVTAPTLLIVGGNDMTVVNLNQLAYDVLQCEKQMVVIPGATHLFEESGALEKVAELAADWFVKHLEHHPVNC